MYIAIALLLVISPTIGSSQTPPDAQESINQQIDNEPKKTNQEIEKNHQVSNNDVTETTQYRATAPNNSSENHSENENIKGISQDKIEQYTKWLVIAAFCQLATFIAQLITMGIQTRRLRETVAATKKAADAADLNARAAIGIELPVIRAITADLVRTDRLIGSNEPYGGIVNDLYPTKYSAVGIIHFENHGRTPAFPEKLSVGWTVAPKLSEEPAYSITSRFNHAAVIKPEGEFVADTHYGIELTDEELNVTSENTSWLWFYGCLYYTDFMNTNRESRFCWRFANRNFDNIFCFFSSDGEPPREYTKNK